MSSCFPGLSSAKVDGTGSMSIVLGVVIEYGVFEDIPTLESCCCVLSESDMVRLCLRTWTGSEVRT